MPWWLLWKRKVQGADVARLEAWEPGGPSMAGGNFLGIRMPRQDLSGIDLSKANLTQADLRKADLERASLSGAKLNPPRRRVNSNLVLRCPPQKLSQRRRGSCRRPANSPRSGTPLPPGCTCPRGWSVGTQPSLDRRGFESQPGCR